MVKSNTPIQLHKIGRRDIWVKREDKCIPGVSFSKVRGIKAHLKNRAEKVVGVLDTRHSKAGWGVSVIGKKLGKKVVVFYPEYKGETGLRPFQKHCNKLGSDLISLPAGRSAILYHQSKKILKEKYEDSYMIPNALQLPESIEENGREAYDHTPQKYIHNTVIIISISSGTIAAGILKGLKKRGSTNDIIIHMGYSRSQKTVENKFNKVLAPSIWDPERHKMNIRFIDEGYEYKDSVQCSVPFPCNPYYDLKAWKWLCENVSYLSGKKNILFWNIGS